MEYLYFRQDINKAGKKNACIHQNCWNAPAGFSNYCVVHLKMARERGTQALAAISERVSDWQKFITRISQEVDKEDANLIDQGKLYSVLAEFGVTVNDSEKDLILQAFIANSDRSKPILNVSRLYSIRLAT